MNSHQSKIGPAVLLFLGLSCGCSRETSVPPFPAGPDPTATLRAKTDSFFQQCNADKDFDIADPHRWEFYFAGVKQDQIEATKEHLGDNGFSELQVWNKDEDGRALVGFYETREHTSESLFQRVDALSKYAQTHGFMLDDWYVGKPAAPNGESISDPTLREARQEADAFLAGLVAGELDDSLGIVKNIEQTFEPFESYVIKSQELAENGGAVFKGVLHNPNAELQTGRRFRFQLSFLRRDGNWVFTGFENDFTATTMEWRSYSD